MHWKKQAEQAILEILKRSAVPEDYAHALNVRDWVRRLKPDAGVALELAALGHDLERALADRKVQRADFDSYDAFKRAHAENSARILQALLKRLGADPGVTKRVAELVRHHEFGKPGDAELTVLKDADSLSFFEVNLPAYYEREGESETRFRMQWGYRRLSDSAKRHLHALRGRHPVLRKLLKDMEVIG